MKISFYLLQSADGSLGTTEIIIIVVVLLLVTAVVLFVAFVWYKKQKGMSYILKDMIEVFNMIFDKETRKKSFINTLESLNIF